MGFWERIRQWFGMNPASGPVTKQPPTLERPRPDTTPVVTSPGGDTLPLPGDTGLDIFQLLFSKKDKHTATMLNSISLSSDMNTLYLIDNGRAIPFDLTVPQGVLVGLLGEQLVVATAIALPTPDDTPDPTVVEGVAADEPGTERRPTEKQTFKVTESSQYSLSYNPKKKALGVIGTGDIVLNLDAPETGGCVSEFTSLDHKGIIRIQRIEDELVVEKMS